MESRALGMIEVRGMLGAVEAADAALKSAAVRLLRSRKVGGGLVTVFLTGEVAAVQSAVDAAVASLGGMGLRCSSHVIPSLSPDVFPMIAEEDISGERPSGCELKDAAGDEDDTDSVLSGDVPDLENMTVMELRRLARTVGLETMTRKQIRFAGKAELLRELMAFWKNRGGESE